MSVTETTRISWGSRLGSSFKGILFGLVLFVAGFPFLFWNEGNAVRTRKALDEGEGACVSVPSNAAVDPANEGALVHMSGLADTAEELRDGEFGVGARAIRFVREAEMYQWQESERTSEKKNLGGSVTRTTVYDYSKGWADEAIDSSSFKEAGHDNPGAMPYQGVSWEAREVSFGAFRLQPDQIARIGGARPFALPADYACPAATNAVIAGGWIHLPAASDGHDPAAAPQIGDMRVRFEVVEPHEISLVYKQSGDTFVPYTAKNGKKVALLADGVRDAADLFASARSANATLCWILRLVGFLMMYFGLSAVLKPLSVLADVIPILGSIVGFVSSVGAFAVAAPCAIATIAVAWLFYRPVLGVALLAAAVALFVWRARRRKAAAAEPVAAN